MYSKNFVRVTGVLHIIMSIICIIYLGFAPSKPFEIVEGIARGSPNFALFLFYVLPLAFAILYFFMGINLFRRLEWSRKLALFVNKFALGLTLLFLAFSYFILPSRTDFINTVAGAIPFIVFFAFIFNLKKDEVKSLFIE